jgi:hypothetical protein
MTTISYLNVSSAADPSADIAAVDAASEADGWKRKHYPIRLKASLAQYSALTQYSRREPQYHIAVAPSTNLSAKLGGHYD